MKRKQVQVIARDSILAGYLKEKLKADPTIEVVDISRDVTVDAVIAEVPLLTRTECELLQAIADHGSVKAAAQAIHRSEDTVKNHMKAIRVKLDVHSTLEAVVWGFRAGVLM